MNHQLTSSEEDEGRSEKRSKRSRDGGGGGGAENTSLNSNETGMMRGGSTPESTTRFIGSGSGIHFIQTVYSMLAGGTIPSTTSEATSPNDIVPGEDDELSNQRNVRPGGSVVSTSPDTELFMSHEIVIDQQSVPSFEQLIVWTKSYFEHWHPIFPLLHAPSVLSVFEVAGRGGLQAVTPADKVLIRALISISTADARQTNTPMPPPPAEYVFRTVNQLVSETQFAISQPATLHNLQALFAAQLFLVSILKFNLASRIGGIVVRMAFHLGLHRCPNRFQNFSPADQQIRRRMFFCVYCLDRILSQSLGLPLGIADSDIDVCYPGEEIHGVTSAASHQEGKHRVYKVFVRIFISTSESV
jgi:hypothetical protein